MASAEASLYTILTGGSPNAVAELIADRVYPNKLPQGVVYPAIRVQRISTPRAQYRVMSTGKAMYARPRFQVDCFALDHAGAIALADAVRSELGGFMGTAAGLRIVTPDPEDEGGDVETNIGPGGVDVYRQRLDFLIGHGEG